MTSHLLLRIDRLEHEQCTAQIPTTLLRNSLVQAIRLGPSLFLSGDSKCRADIVFSWCSHPDQQGTRANGRDNVGSAVGQENQSQVRAVLFHRTSQRGLGVTSEVVGFIDHDNLEPLLRGQIHLLCLCNFFQQFLDHDAVVVSNVGGSNLKVVNGGDNVEFELAVAGGLEDSRIDLDLFDTGAV